MKTVYYTDAWEHEFGSRFEGYIVATSLDKLKIKKDQVESGGTPECYWRCGDIIEAQIEDITYEELDKVDYTWVDNFKSFNIYKKL